MIEYAHIITKKELDDFFKSISKNTTDNKSKAWECMFQNKDALFDDYYKLEQQQVYVFYEEKEKLEKEKKSWDDKVCDACGNKMKIVNYEFGDFWGCTNYRDSSFKHRRFPLNYDEHFFERWKNLHVRISSKWVTDIIRKNGLQAIVKASDLLNFYDEFCLEDLREKYGYKNSKDTISGYVKAKKASSNEEKIVAKHLSPLFAKSNEQIGIRYKFKEHKDKIAIVDLILSDKTEVNIIEIKRTVLDINVKQLQLYHSLISFILKETNDLRLCRSLFIVYNTESFYYKPDSKYLSYDRIKNINNKALIQKYFKESGYLNDTKE